MSVRYATLICLAASLPLFARSSSSISLTASPGTSTLGTSVTLTATVSPSSATGTITFYDGVNLVGAKQLAAGKAVVSTSLLATGTHSLTAYYGGDANFNPSTSTVTKEIVNAVPEVGFGPPIAVDNAVGRVVVADFNNDGYLDLAVSNGATLLGNGKGGFVAANNFGFGVPGDFDGDGKTDLLTLNANTVAVMLGKGDGSFTAGQSFSLAAGANSILVADFNGDGKADALAVVNTAGAASLTFLAGNGDGTFSAGVTAYSGNAYVQPEQAAIGDFNGDGKPDLITINANLTVTVLIGNGNGTFGSPVIVAQQAFDESASQGSNSGIVVADFNSDGVADFAVALSQSLGIFTGNGNGTFQTGPTYPLTWSDGYSYLSIAAGDLNGDGNLDLVTATTGGVITVFSGAGNGNFTQENPGIALQPAYNANPLVLGDFNGDGRTDILGGFLGGQNIFGLVNKLGLFPGTAASVSTSIPFFTATANPSYASNGYSGDVGMGFTVSSLPITITALGRYVLPGNSQVHHLSIPGTAADGFVNLNGATPGTFVYVAVPPTVLQPGHSYQLLSSEVGGGDTSGTPSETSTGAALALTSIPAGGSEFGPPGPVNFEYQIGGAFLPSAPVFPSVSVTSPVNNASVSGTINVTASATPTAGNSIAGVQFQIGAILLPPITSPPYTVSFDTTKLVNGTQNVTASVVDSAFNSASSTPVKVTVNNAASSLTPLVTTPPVTSTRNNYYGFVGMQITVGATGLQVSQLGRWVASGNKQVHTVKIIDLTTGLDVAGGSVALDLQGVAAGAYAYAPLASPVTLFANSSYYIVSQEFNGGDLWYGLGPVSVGAVTVNGGVYTDVLGKYFLVGGAGTSYVPVNLLYTPSGSSQAPPTVTITTPSPGNVSGIVTATATALPAPGLSIASVQFQLNGANIGTPITSSPYTESLNFGSVPPGTAVLTAIATDTAANKGTSPGVSLNVVSSSGNPFITSFSGGPLRNNYSGNVGMQFTVGVLPVTVTALGRYAAGGNTQTHNIQLFDVQYTGDFALQLYSLRLLASAQVSMNGVPTGQFAYATLSSPTTLYNGTYLLVSQEFSGGDQWYDLGPATGTSAGTIVGPVYSDAAGNFQAVPIAGASYVPANFLYTQTEAVTITQPTTYMLSGVIQLSASAVASPGLTITSVQFKFNGNNIGPALTTAPYTTTFDTSKLPNGIGTLVAIATDSAGGTVSTSAGAGVYINNVSAGSPFFSLLSAGTLRNNYSGFVGTEFSVPNPVVVSQLGRYTVSGNTQTHTLKLLNADGSAIAGASVSIPLSGQLPGQFNYVSLTTPVYLQANIKYILVSQEFSGGDQWYDYNSTLNLSLGYPASAQPVYADAAGNYVLVSGAAHSYVPVNFTFASSATTPAITAQPSSPLRNNYSGYVGMQFAIGSSDLLVSQLARYVVAGNNQAHILKFVNSDGSDVIGGAASIALSGATPGQFAYVDLPSPIYLKANTTYYLVSQEFSGGDQWYDYTPVTPSAELGPYNPYVQPVYTDAAGKYVTVQVYNYSYVPVNFQ